MRSGIWLIILLFMPFGHAEECVTHFSELTRTAHLQAIQNLFKNGVWAGLVNGSKGSYVLLENRDDTLHMTFYTSGLFDLTAIKREGPVRFCETAKGVKMIGIDRVANIQIEGEILHIDGGGARRTFHLGDMPEPLQRLHHVSPRGLALSEP